jgi:hypothetical protein
VSQCADVPVAPQHLQLLRHCLQCTQPLTQRCLLPAALHNTSSQCCIGGACTAGSDCGYEGVGPHVADKLVKDELLLLQQPGDKGLWGGGGGGGAAAAIAAATLGTRQANKSTMCAGSDSGYKGVGPNVADELVKNEFLLLQQPGDKGLWGGGGEGAQGQVAAAATAATCAPDATSGGEHPTTCGPMFSASVNSTSSPAPYMQATSPNQGTRIHTSEAQCREVGAPEASLSARFKLCRKPLKCTPHHLQAPVNP